MCQKPNMFGFIVMDCLIFVNYYSVHFLFASPLSL